jgi:ribosomal protein S18 acetylase RimI-like enzyme
VLRQFGSWDEAAQDGWFEQGLADAEFSVVELNGEPMGAIALKDSSDRLYLVELQIAPEWQAQGLGSALLRAQLDRARLLRKPISLRVLLQNRARSLYERHGFVVTGQTETHYLMERQPDASTP